MKNIDEIKRKIRNLKNMTVENGCTQDEAIAAANKAREFIKNYDLDERILDFEENHIDLGRSRRDVADKMCCAIAVYCGCDLWLRTDRNSSDKWTLHVVYFGKEPAPVLAEYVHDICFRALQKAVQEEKETARYKRRRKPRPRRQHIKAFKLGFALAISSRLALTADAENMAAARISQEEVAKLNMNFRKRKALAKVDQRISGVQYQGYQEGHKFDIHEGVTTPRPKMIGEGL